MAGNPKSNKWEAEGIAALEWKGIEARVRSLVGFEVLKSSGYLGSNKWEAPTVSALENRVNQHQRGVCSLPIVATRPISRTGEITCANLR
jgi:hypothetical protein